MKAFVLCAGLGTRLRPFTYYLPKSSMPFLNLPLLAYGWFYLEQMGVSQFVFNSYLFPVRLKKDIEFLKKPSQETHLVVEKQRLDSAGGFYNVKKHFENEKIIFYLNGDSLFFPSHIRLLNQFKDCFIQQEFEASLFGITPHNIKKDQSYLWVNKNGILKQIGSPSPTLSHLQPIGFSGLALFKQEFLNHLEKNKSHIFLDVIKPTLAQNKYKVFIDEKGYLLESGDEKSYLKASQFCLKSLFCNDCKSETTDILKNIFDRFDLNNQKVNLKFSKKLSQKKQALILSPYLKNTKHLTVHGFAVLGADVQFKKPSVLKNSVLIGPISWEGELQSKILLKP